ncbi:MAG: tRNA (N6-threonylcarbamoyladenosine(37)-N6)-methyltransferase TrmO, partial [Bdellovibrionaceae bacterium]|nr:tRNA (N6-threonylcarbamoyladenosine(37)-N6)-methyltransferase TrmO [Pseudobdellovibrionaceae bacterium]
MTSFEFTAIAHVESPFKGKFGVPRQPALASRAKARLVFANDPDLRHALRGLEGFSHAWVIFVFHLHGAKKWKPSVRPPRLGGDVKMGVLASRSMHRPNPVGLSVVKIESVDLDAPEGPVIAISGHDLLDGTPVLDIKPYLPYADAVAGATSAWAEPEVPRRPVLFSPEALRTI